MNGIVFSLKHYIGALQWCIVCAVAVAFLQPRRIHSAGF